MYIAWVLDTLKVQTCISYGLRNPRIILAAIGEKKPQLHNIHRQHNIVTLTLGGISSHVFTAIAVSPLDAWICSQGELSKAQDKQELAFWPCNNLDKMHHITAAKLLTEHKHTYFVRSELKTFKQHCCGLCSPCEAGLYWVLTTWTWIVSLNTP